MTTRHRRCLIVSFNKLAWILIAVGGVVALAYIVEIFLALAAGSPFERFAMQNRMTGPYAWGYWLMLFSNVVAPQLFWFRKCRTHPALSFLVSLAIVTPSLCDGLAQVLVRVTNP